MLESEAERAVKGWIEYYTGGTIHWPLREDNKVEYLCQLISSLNLKNKIKNVLVVSDKSEEFQNWNLESAFNLIISICIFCIFASFSMMRISTLG